MSVTFAELQTQVSRDIRDTSHNVFLLDEVKDMINAAVVEVGRLAPERFTEDIFPLSGTLEYQLRSSVFNGENNADIDVKRVELWDNSLVPATQIWRLWPASAEYADSSQAGWQVWNGVLSITNMAQEAIDITLHVLKVWGYSPYAPLVDDGDVFNGNASLQQAVRDYCRVSALERLNMDRDLFTQWQTHANNADVSPAGLMNALSLAQEQWRRKAHAIYVPRS